MLFGGSDGPRFRKQPAARGSLRLLLTVFGRFNEFNQAHDLGL
jgi:hypothetical protein